MRGAVIAHLPELSVFGESALFGGEHATRNATVSAQGGRLVKVLVLAKGKWERLVRSGVLSKACVATLRAVRDRRETMNARGFKSGKIRPALPPPPAAVPFPARRPQQRTPALLPAQRN